MLGTTLSKLLLLGAVILVVLTVSGCGEQEHVAQAQPEPEEINEDWNFDSRFVGKLPIEDQIKIASCVKLSSQGYWGEGGPMYPREVAEAFLLAFPYPDIGEYTTGSPGEKKKSAVAFLYQQPADNRFSHPSAVYRRGIWLYTDYGTYQINLWLDEDGHILETSLSFACNFKDLPFESVECFTLIKQEWQKYSQKESQEHVAAQTPPRKRGFVSKQSIEEQIRIAGCVKLSDQYKWGEPSPAYPKEVAKAFLLDFPFPDLPELTPWLETKNVAWLHQKVVCYLCYLCPHTEIPCLDNINS